MLKSDFAVDPLARQDSQHGSFRSFVSRSISVLDVQGGAINLRKGVSATSDVHLIRLRRGTVQLAHAEGNTTVEAGQFVAYRGAQALQFRHEQEIDMLGVFLPGSALERWLPDWDAAEFVVSNDRAEGRLSFDIAHNLLDSAHQLQDKAAAEVVGETVARLLARALASTSLADAAEPADLAEARRRRVRHFCRKNLGSPHLSVELVARGTCLSRAAIHRLFHDQTHTLMQWVQLERLEACRRELAAVSVQPPTLTEIALANGWKSSAHFSAAFRQRYGQTPRAFRAMIQADATTQLHDRS
jgi:AraC-like DNA-binding protein